MKDYDVNVQRFHLVNSPDAGKTAAQDLSKSKPFKVYAQELQKTAPPPW